MGKHLRRIITLWVTAPRPLPQDKNASGQPPDAQMNDLVLAGWGQCLIVMVKAPWAEKGSLNVDHW